MSSTSPTSPASPSFKYFSLLPPEIRRYCWNLNLPPPLLVPLHYTPPRDPNIPITLHGSTSPAPIPANLHTTRESRACAQAHYQLSFPLMHCPPKIFFRPSTDILYFGFRVGLLASFEHFINATTLIERSELGKVGKLAVHEGLFVDGNCRVMDTHLAEFWGVVRRKFEGVEEMAILVSKESAFPVTGLLEDGGKRNRCENEEGGLECRARRALLGVERSHGWKAPKWNVVVLDEELGVEGSVMNGFVEPVGGLGIVVESIAASALTGVDDKMKEALMP